MNFSKLPKSARITESFSKAKNVFIYDYKKKYFDFSTNINQGHFHPQIVYCTKKQINKYNTNNYFEWNQKIKKLFGYENTITSDSFEGIMNNLFKINKKIIVLNHKYYQKYKDNTIFSFNLKHVRSIAYNNPDAFAILIEPIQINESVKIFEDGYLNEIHDICKKTGLKLIIDESNTSLGRTGKLLCSEYHKVKPDYLILNNSLCGGIFNMYTLLGNNFTDINSINNDLYFSLSNKSLEVIENEELIEKSYDLGYYFRNYINNEKVRKVYGKGLMNFIDFEDDYYENLKNSGIITKKINDNTLQFSPPLTITKKQLMESVEIINQLN
jgi:ornithine--oxo-acid transaminase